MKRTPRKVQQTVHCTTVQQLWNVVLSQSTVARHARSEPLVSEAMAAQHGEAHGALGGTFANACSAVSIFSTSARMPCTKRDDVIVDIVIIESSRSCQPSRIARMRAVHIGVLHAWLECGHSAPGHAGETLAFAAAAVCRRDMGQGGIGAWRGRAWRTSSTAPRMNRSRVSLYGRTTKSVVSHADWTCA